MTDTPDRRERLLNLLAALLESRQGLTRDEIVTNVSLGYPPAPESARKAFERDKASLRAMGVPVREENRDNEFRYRVDPNEYYLPDLELAEGELEALHVAVTAIGLGAGSGEGAGALMKLGGLEGTGGMPVAELPLVDALAPLFDASRRRAAVEFEYRGRSRRIEPWGLTSKFGRWYVVGQDLGSGEMRVFRADRIAGDVVATEPDAFTVPADFLADAYLADQPWEYGGGAAIPVWIRIDAGHETELAGQVNADTPIVREEDGSVVVELSVVNLDGLRSFVLGYLDHAEVLSPPEARAVVIDWLTAIAGDTP
ncbi:MAG: helix-turn-helix transcriptional regulator [Acidimicrobiia bacterium]